jgi:hypothetical protein
LLPFPNRRQLILGNSKKKKEKEKEKEVDVNGSVDGRRAT